LLKIWISADCASAISPCATYANNAEVTTWKDRSGNANDLADGVNSGAYSDCHLRTSQINGKPAVQFQSGSNNCAYQYTSTGFDATNTYWYVFAVLALQDTSTHAQDLMGGFASSGNAPKSFSLDLSDNGLIGSPCTSNVYFCMWSSGNGAMAQDNHAVDTSYHVLVAEYSKPANGNFAVFRMDGASDGPSSFSTPTIDQGQFYLGVNHINGAFNNAVKIYLAEFGLYTGTTALDAAKISSTESCLKTEYGL
jgi:hypothetical protein